MMNDCPTALRGRPPHGVAGPASRSWIETAMAGGALVIAALPMALTALAVRTTVGRPIFFVQQRAGLHARPFAIRKFRTMRDAFDAEGRPLPDEARLTPGGRLLRRLRLDELPQILAIISGEMTFVGPRPLLPETIRDQGALGLVRSSVRPGVTGWAQIHGNTRLSERQKLALDIWYVDHRSLALDLRIVVTTLWTLLRGERVSEEAVARAERHLAGRTGEA